MHASARPLQRLSGSPRPSVRLRDSQRAETAVSVCETLAYRSGRKAHPVGLALTGGVSGSAGTEDREMTRTVTRALGYIRVSTEEQATNGHGLAAQHDAITAEANRRGLEVTILADEGMSGSQVNPSLRDCIDQLRTGRADALIVAKMDRLARSVSNAADILDAARTQGWDLIICDLGVDLSTPTGEAMANMLATFAQLERRLISQRTKEGLAAAKAKGKRIGRPRLATASAVDRIVSNRDQGQSFAAIASALTADGQLSPAGRPTWQASTVRRIYHAAALRNAG